MEDKQGMHLRKKDEWFWQVNTEFNRLADEMLRSTFGPALATRRFWEPRVDVCESDGMLIIKAELAGIDTKSLQVELSADQRSLIIRGTRSEQAIEPEPRTRCHHLEIYYGDFERTINLPEVGLDKDNIKATYQNGFLLITIPKVTTNCLESNMRTNPTEE
jgi:HSP20 family protein